MTETATKKADDGKQRFKARRRKRPKPQALAVAMDDLTSEERLEVNALLEMDEGEYRDNLRRYLIFPDRSGSRIFSCPALAEYSEIAALQLIELYNRAERSASTVRAKTRQNRAKARAAHMRARAVSFHRQLQAKAHGNELRHRAEALLGEEMIQVINSIQRDLASGLTAAQAKAALRERLGAWVDARRANMEARAVVERLIADVYYSEIARPALAELARGKSLAEVRKAMEGQKRRSWTSAAAGRRR